MFAANVRVLVVDDMQTMRSMLKGQLRTLGLKEFMEAENGEEALKILTAQATKNEPIQLILSDWNMPVMPGIELLKKVKSNANFKDVPFVMITAEGEVHQVKEAITAGVSNYIVKPFSADTLAEKLANVAKKLGGG
ncbi:MAG TPA: response regulator [Bdellovibrionota bacterium]|jgi:two-component system chemotaxis response regulator CheY|nr:response regulator [Bdellovibrionota bacterium]